MNVGIRHFGSGKCIAECMAPVSQNYVGVLRMESTYVYCLLDLIQSYIDKLATRQMVDPILFTNTMPNNTMSIHCKLWTL